MATKKPTSKVTLRGFSKESKTAIHEQYERLKSQGKIKGSFQTYLNKSGQDYFNTFYKNLSKSAGKFSINALLNIASGEYSRYFII